MPKLLSWITAVIFDINYTLIHPARPMGHVQTLAGRLGVTAAALEAELNLMNDDFERGKISPGRRIMVAAAKLGIFLDQGTITSLVRIEIRETGKDWRFYSGTERVLRLLRANGYKVGLCSNQNPIGKTIVRSMGLDRVPETVDSCVLSCDSGTVKPEDRIFGLICMRLGVEPSNCLFVGDGGSHELAGARRAGMTTVRVMHADGYAAMHPDKPESQADYEIRRIRDLPGLLNRTR